MIFLRLKAQLRDLVGGGIRFEKCMVDHARQGSVLGMTPRWRSDVPLPRCHMPGIVKASLDFDALATSTHRSPISGFTAFFFFSNGKVELPA